MKRLILAAMVAVAMVAAPKAADAAIVIDFQGGAGGSIVNNGSNWSGSIPLIIMTAYNTPLHPGGVTCNPPVTGCFAWTATATLTFNTATGQISVDGSVAGLVGTQNLLSGTFSGFSVVSGGGGTIAFSGFGIDAKSRELLTALGLPTNTPFSFFGFSIAMFNPSGDNNYIAVSTDIANTAIPEPGTMALLGTGLLGLAAATRRRLRKQ